MSLLAKIINRFSSVSQGINKEKIIAGWSPSEKAKETYRLLGAEGIVLLRNNDILPISKTDNLAVFGRVQNDYFYVGYGSGGDVISPYRVSLMEGIENNGIKVNEKIKNIYKQFSKDSPPDEGFWGHWPLAFPEMEISTNIIQEAARESNVALVVIGRAAGEDRDQKLQKGAFYLTDEEDDLLARVYAFFKKVIILLDLGNIMDMSFIEKYSKASVLIAWQGGMESGNSVADVLCGKVNPSGKLTDTIARRYEDYPSINFGGSQFNNYTEDIYVGYRYFETFNKDAVLFPFGYGLSYTSFDISSKILNENNIKIKATIQNTGDMVGKEVVQVYVEKPHIEIGVPARELIGFAKTNDISPNSSEVVIIDIDNMAFASYNEGKAAYVITSGIYNIYVGNNVRDAKFVGSIGIDEDIENTLSNLPMGDSDFDIICPKYDGEDISLSSRKLYDSKVDEELEIESNLPKEILPQTGLNIRLIDVLNGDYALDDFISTLSDSDLEDLSHGDYRMNSKYGPIGNAGAFGGITKSLKDKGIPIAICTDGPAGIRLKVAASLVPSGAAIASSWNEKLAKEAYSYVGAEMLEKGTDILLGPGMNIHRSPLCGRNFEYFSEDPILSGKIASAIVKGIQSKGVSACLKHFACNNQETRRTHNDSRVSERALREIYLKGFEIAVKESSPYFIMTSYNKINSVYAYNNYSTVTKILRNEWGYNGALMTDWWTVKDTNKKNKKIFGNAYRIRAGVNVLMPGGSRILARYSRDGIKSMRNGGLTRAEMQRNAKYALEFLLACPSTRKKIK